MRAFIYWRKVCWSVSPCWDWVSRAPRSAVKVDQGHRAVITFPYINFNWKTWYMDFIMPLFLHLGYFALTLLPLIKLLLHSLYRCCCPRRSRGWQSAPPAIRSEGERGQDSRTYGVIFGPQSQSDGHSGRPRPGNKERVGEWAGLVTLYTTSVILYW